MGSAHLEFPQRVTPERCSSGDCPMTEPAGTADPAEPETISTGCAGLDDILGGGLDADRMYLLEGRPGTGKTTLALQFLLEGKRRGEGCLYVTLSESERELRVVAARHG